MTVANRLVVSPMCQYSAQDGVPGDWHLVHYGSRAIGGAGLMFTEMTNVSEKARITHGCTGMYSDAQEAAWKRIVDFVHANSAVKFCLQLGHAGRKGATRLMWEGIDEPLEQGGWPIVSASPLPYFPHSQVPREMTRADMDAAIADYVQAVKRGDRAGFDMVELHAAHGYLIASFISPLTNVREDEYGGALQDRMRFPLEVFRAMRAAWPDEKPMSVRISATDWVEGGLTGDDAVEVARAVRRGRLRSGRRIDGPDRARIPSRCSAACSRRHSQTRSATRPDSPPCASALSPARTRPTPSSRPAAPTLSRLPGRTSLTLSSPCAQPPGTPRRSTARRNISPARSRFPQQRARSAGA